MTYIINPMWVYWLNVVGQIREVILTFAIVSLVFAALYFTRGAVIRTDAYSKDDFEYSESERILRKAKILVGVAVVLCVIFALIPSKEAIIEMQIARFATVENAEWTLDAVKSATDYIVSAIRELQ